MAVEVETLEKLERKVTLSLPAQSIQDEVDKRLRKLSRQVKMDGFRPGKVPLSVVAQRYGDSVRHEVINDKVGEAFFKAIEETGLNIAGHPAIRESEKEEADGDLTFDAIFEVVPEVQIGDLSGAKIEKATAEVDDAAVARTLEILRKQRRSFAQRAKDDAASDDDRVTIDFIGKIDGEAFEGGKAEGFQFIVGEGQMLKEFEDAVRGMKVGEKKTFPLSFPQDYHGKDVAGKTADFMVTMNKIEAAHLPEVNDQLAKSLGVADATVAGLNADIRKNLEREVKYRLIARNKQAVMDALMEHAELDLPKVTVHQEVHRLMDGMREDLKARGMKDVDQLPLSEESFQPEAERRVRLGLIVAELVKREKLQATPEEVKAQVEELAASYEKPEEVVRYYYSDNSRLAGVEAMVIENKVTEHVLSQAQVSEKQLSFEDLMDQQSAGAPAAGEEAEDEVEDKQEADA